MKDMGAAGFLKFCCVVSTMPMSLIVTVTVVGSQPCHAALRLIGDLTYSSASNTGIKARGDSFGPISTFTNERGIAVGNSWVYPGSKIGVTTWNGGSAVQIQTASSIAVVNCINDSGDIVGNINGLSFGVPVRWNAGSSTAIQLKRPTIGNETYKTGQALGISDVGAMVGYLDKAISTSAAGTRAVRWDSVLSDCSFLEDFGVLTNGTARSQATVINQQGDVAGFASPVAASGASFTERVAVRWPAGSTAMQALDRVYEGTRNEYVVDMNDAGAVLAYSAVIAMPVRWNGGGTSGMLLQGTGAGSTYAARLNAAGDAVGASDRQGLLERSRAVRWDFDSEVPQVLQDLGANSHGDVFAEALDINDLGYSVGRAKDPAGSIRATLWRPDDSVLDLNNCIDPDSSWFLIQAGSLSNTGFVSGTGEFDPDGDGPIASYWRHFTVLVPEAGTYGRGDANFDTQINFDDLLLLAQHYGESNPTQDIHVGDFDLNGSVNFDDLLALAQHYESAPALLDANQFGSTFAADWAMARSLVPEPMSLAAGLVLLPAVRRRRAV